MEALGQWPAAWRDQLQCLFICLYVYTHVCVLVCMHASSSRRTAVASSFNTVRGEIRLFLLTRSLTMQSFLEAEPDDRARLWKQLQAHVTRLAGFFQFYSEKYMQTRDARKKCNFGNLVKALFVIFLCCLGKVQIVILY